MNIIQLSLLVSVGISPLLSTPQIAHAARPKTVRFYCGQSFDVQSNKIVPTTYAATSVRAEPVAILRWQTKLAGYDQQKRCNLVSAKFQQAWQRHQLNFIKAGVSPATSQGIICGVAAASDACDRSSMLFTLKNSDLARNVVREIEQIRHGTGGNGINESATEPIVNLADWLK